MKRQVYAASRCRTIDEMSNKGNVEVQALVDGSEVDLYALLVLIRMFFFISSANLPTGECQREGKRIGSRAGYHSDAWIYRG
jgi:hypothetical protein